MDFNPLPADVFNFNHTYATLGVVDGNFHLFNLVGDPDEIYPLASVTKTIAAYAVLVAVAQDELSLTDSVGEVLRTSPLFADISPVDLPEVCAGVTLNHLLTHTAGLPLNAEWTADSFNLYDPAKLGKRRIYSNFAFDVLGHYLELRYGIRAPDFVAQKVLIPLNMDTCLISGSLAHSGVSSLDSLLRFAQELLAPTLLPSAFLAQALQPQFPGIAGVLPGFSRHLDNAWATGFELRGSKDPHWLGADFAVNTFGHFGQAGSFIWVDPTVQKAGVFLGEQNFGALHKQVWPVLTSQMRALNGQ